MLGDGKCINVFSYTYRMTFTDEDAGLELRSRQLKSDPVPNPQAIECPMAAK